MVIRFFFKLQSPPPIAAATYEMDVLPLLKHFHIDRVDYHAVSRRDSMPKECFLGGICEMNEQISR